VPHADTDQAVDFLLGRHLVEALEIVDGHLIVSAARGRNQNLRVERHHAPGYLVKRSDPGTAGDGDTLATEAVFYGLCHREAHLADLAEKLPRLHLHDPEHGLLITELLPDHAPLWQRDPEGLVGPCRDLGSLLGSLHRLFQGLESAPPEDLPPLPTSVPWALSIACPRIELLPWMSGAQRRMLTLVQQQASLSEALISLEARWCRETLIHGDVRSENVLVGEGIVLVDWELVQWGDPAWDVAGGLQDLLLHWIRSLPTSPELTPEERAAQATKPLSELRPAVGALWEGYRQGAALGPEDADALLARAVPFSAARLLQSAYEQAAGRGTLPDVAVLSLQVATNVLAAPDSARVHLYGLDADL